MIVYPAIDLRQGRCVRLRQGDPKAETVYSEDPVATAQHWVAQGASWLHIVNLDGAFGEHGSRRRTSSSGNVVQRLRSPNDLPTTGDDKPSGLPLNLQRLRQIRQAVSASIQFGGGLRSLEDIALVFELGADRVVLGTVAVKNQDLVRTAISRWGADRIVVGIDARDGKVAIRGWQEISEVDAVDLAHHMTCLGVKRIVYTDISRDGMLQGVNVTATSNLGDMTDLKVIASGGVADLYDIRRLKRHEHYNIEGVIIGQALYTGKIDLAEAIDIADGPLVRCSAGLVPFRRTADGPELLLLWNSFFEQWQFPRGGIEEGETALTCAKREFGLETALPLRTLYTDYATTLAYVARIRDYDVERVVTYFLAEVGEGEAVLGHDNHSEFRWAPLDEAKEMLMDTSPEQLPALETAMIFFEGQAHRQSESA